MKIGRVTDTCVDWCQSLNTTSALYVTTDPMVRSEAFVPNNNLARNGRKELKSALMKLDMLKSESGRVRPIPFGNKSLFSLDCSTQTAWAGSRAALDQGLLKVRARWGQKEDKVTSNESSKFHVQLSSWSLKLGMYVEKSRFENIYSSCADLSGAPSHSQTTRSIRSMHACVQHT